MSKNFRGWLLGLTILVLIVSFSTQLLAQEPEEARSYFYYKGIEVTLEEVTDKSYHCVQEITSETVESRSSNRLLCFDTIKEVEEQKDRMQSFIDELRLQVSGNKAKVPGDTAKAPQLQWAPHWAVYYNSFYNGLNIEIYCRAGGPFRKANTTIWSVWPDGATHWLSGTSYDGSTADYITYSPIAGHGPSRSVQILQCNLV